MPLLFAVGVALGFTNNDGVSGLAAIVGYGIMAATLGVLAQMDVESAQAAAQAAGQILDDRSIDLITKQYETGVLGGILVGGIAAWSFNRFFKIQLPEYLGFFAGKRAVPIITGFLAIALALVLSIVWYQSQWLCRRSPIGLLIRTQPLLSVSTVLLNVH